MIRGKNTQQMMQECEKHLNEIDISEEVEGTERNGFNRGGFLKLIPLFHIRCI